MSNIEVPADRPLRVAFVGWGAIARAAAEILRESHIEIVAVAVRDPDVAPPDLPATTTLVSAPADLAATAPAVVAEAAGRETVGPWGRAALEAGAIFIVSSVSAFADADLLRSLRASAERSGAQIHVHPGALAGVDALAAARAMGIDEVEHRIVKPPAGWRGSPAEELCDLDELDEPIAFFTGTAAETASRFPKNANVAMTTALAGIGPERTKVTLVADPSAVTNRHEVAAHGAFGRLDVAIGNTPLPSNPRTSAMAALSLARAIEHRATSFVI